MVNQPTQVSWNHFKHIEKFELDFFIFINIILWEILWRTKYFFPSFIEMSLAYDVALVHCVQRDNLMTYALQACGRMITTSLVNTHHRKWVSITFSCVRTFKIYDSLSNFQMYGTVLVTAVPGLFTTPPGLSHSRKFALFDRFHSFPPPPKPHLWHPPVCIQPDERQESCHVWQPR